jgi:hypothetical protein
MHSPSLVLSNVRLADEVANAPLGDKRRSDRFVEIVLRLAEDPQASIPDAMKSEAAAEAYYRLMRNEAVDHFSLNVPHIESTQKRCAGLATLLVVHDTTEFAFDIHDEPARENLARLSMNRQGFHWHASLAVTADGLRAPMGLVESRPFVHASEIEGEESVKMWSEIDGIMANEQERWLDSVERSDARLTSVGKVIHVMDREGDDYLTLFPMLVAGYSFVVRMVGNRNVSTGPRRKDFQSLEEALEEVLWNEDERDVMLSARPKRKAKNGHPVRRARQARLKMRSVAVELRRPNQIPADHAPDRIAVHVVEVCEVAPPKDEEPVRWLLVTDQPIDTSDACWQVVDWYRSRWVIEEYFKAIKTGAGYTKLQHRRAQTLLAALSAKLVIGWHLLIMRNLARDLGDADAAAVVNPVQLHILRLLKPKLIGAEPTAEQVMQAVAQLGGHLKRNGPPGWMTLGKGYAHLLELEKGFRMATNGGKEM